MLRTNLATRPFYNERAAHVAIGVAAVIVLAITVLNAVQVVRLSRHNTELSSRTGAERAEATRLTAEAARIRSTIDQDELALIVGAAHEANSLIDQRTFSWTALFNRIEETLPAGVMLTSVQPSIREGAARVDMGVLGRSAEDIDEFMDKLEATGAFQDIIPASQDRTEEGLYRASLETVYTGSQNGEEPAAPPSKAPATGGRP